jgi:hypothetical protein
VSRGQRNGSPRPLELGFLDRSRYFSIQVACQLSSRGWVDPIPDPLLLRKSGSAGNRTRDLWICSQELWPLDHRGGHTHTIPCIKYQSVYQNSIKFGHNLCSALQSTRLTWEQNSCYNFHVAEAFIQHYSDKLLHPLIAIAAMWLIYCLSVSNISTSASCLQELWLSRDLTMSWNDLPCLHMWRVCCHRGVFDVRRLFLTPTCRVSSYLRQVIEVDASLPTTLYLTHSANHSYNAYNRYTTRHL